MTSRPLLALFFAALAGCSSTTEDAATAPSNLDEAPSAPDLTAVAQQRWQENEAVKPLAGSVLVYQIDGGELRTFEEDKGTLEADVPDGVASFVALTTHAAEPDSPFVTASSDPPELRFWSKTADPALAVGTLACAAFDGKLEIRAQGEKLQSDPAACSLTIASRTTEALPPEMIPMAAPSTLWAGAISATVLDGAGRQHAVRAGFVIAERPRS